MANEYQGYSARRLTVSECREKCIDPKDIPITILIEHEPTGARAAFTFPTGGPSIEQLMNHEEGQRFMRAMLDGFQQGISTLEESEARADERAQLDSPDRCM